MVGTNLSLGTGAGEGSGPASPHGIRMGPRAGLETGNVVRCQEGIWPLERGMEITAWRIQVFRIREKQPRRERCNRGRGREMKWGKSGVTWSLRFSSSVEVLWVFRGDGIAMRVDACYV